MIEHHLHSVIVSYKRLELTQRTLESYLATISMPHTLMIVDNGSPSDVTDWLAELTTTSTQVLFLPENRFPGFATNRGWDFMPVRTTLLQRIDNDTLLLPGWCDEMIEAFEDPTVGQYGLAGEADGPWTAWPTWPVGGNSIIRRSLYDAGLRYDESPWGTTEYAEDQMMFDAVRDMGYRRVFASIPSMEYMGGGDESYYTEVRSARGLG